MLSKIILSGALSRLSDTHTQIITTEGNTEEGGGVAPLFNLPLHVELLSHSSLTCRVPQSTILLSTYLLNKQASFSLILTEKSKGVCATRKILWCLLVYGSFLLVTISNILSKYGTSFYSVSLSVKGEKKRHW